MSEAKHKFMVDLRKNAAFGQGRLRDYFTDRILGVAEATGGMVMAEVHKANGSCPEGGSGRHFHSLDFQMNYLLKGWLKMEFEGEGIFTFEPGDVWVQPPEIKHEVLDFSEDMEVLEICMPAKFGTTEA